MLKKILTHYFTQKYDISYTKQQLHILEPKLSHWIVVIRPFLFSLPFRSQKTCAWSLSQTISAVNGSTNIQVFTCLLLRGKWFTSLYGDINVSILLTWFHVLGIFFLFAFITQRKLQQRAEWKWGELKWTREDHGWTSTKDISLCCVLTTLDSWMLFIFYCCCFLSSVTAFWNYDETLLLYTHQHIGLLLGSAYIHIKSNYWSSIFFMPTLGQL